MTTILIIVIFPMATNRNNLYVQEQMDNYLNWRHHRYNRKKKGLYIISVTLGNLTDSLFPHSQSQMGIMPNI